MTTAYWCVLVVVLFPYVFTVLAKSGPGFNNRTPREALEHLKGWRKRAHWAQLNSFEAMPGFIAAVLIAEQLHVPQWEINRLAMAFVAMRVLYAICYIADKYILRSLAWFVGLGIVIALFVTAAGYC